MLNMDLVSESEKVNNAIRIELEPQVAELLRNS